MNKKIVAVIAVVVAIVVIVGGGIGGYIYQLSSQKIGMKDILVSLDEKTNGIEVWIITVPKEFSGTATLGIIYNEASVYDTTIDVKNGEGKKTIPYTDFVSENGNYTFEATFKDKTKTKGCSIYGVVTKIDVYANAILDGTQPKIEVSVWPNTVAPLGNASVTIIQVDDVVLVNAALTLSATTGIYSGTFSYTNSGYYTLHAELTNYVKNGSVYEKVTGYVKNETGGDLNLIDLPPEITVYPQDITIYSRDNATPPSTPLKQGCEGWVHFASTGNAQGIYNEVTFSAVDHDGTFSAVWDMGYNWTTENSTGRNDTRTGDDFWYNYPKVEEGAIKQYTVRLYVHDEYFMSEICEFTITVRY